MSKSVCRLLVYSRLTIGYKYILFIFKERIHFGSGWIKTFWRLMVLSLSSVLAVGVCLVFVFHNTTISLASLAKGCGESVKPESES